MNNNYKLAFVAHEFGLFKGHGGIASYLLNIVKYILNNHKNYKVYVLTLCYDENSTLLEDYDNSLEIIKIKNSYECTNILEKINPDYVEVADYLALCLDALLLKRMKIKFHNTIFAVHHHTATRECYVWNSKLPINYAHPNLKTIVQKEITQILLSDIQIAPSNFMKNYVKQNYHINSEIKVYHHYIQNENKSKMELYKKFNEYYELDLYKESFNIVLITRIEGRKNQEYLISEFIKFKNDNNINNAKLFLIGNSNIDEITGEEIIYSIYKKIDEKDRDNIFFYDFAKSNSKELFYSIADISILPSYYENFPMAMVEVLSYGIPIMVSKTSGCCDYLGDTYDIMTFDSFKEGDLAKTLLNFYNMSKENRENIVNIQQNKLKEVTDPKKSIGNRLLFFNNYKEENNINNYSWEIIDYNDILNNNIYKLNNNHIVFIPDENMKEIVLNFINDFSFNKNLLDKIIILNDKYTEFDDIKCIAFNMLPIIIPNFKTNDDNIILIDSIYKYLYKYFSYIVQIQCNKLSKYIKKNADKKQLIFLKKSLEVILYFENNNKNILEELYDK